MNNSPLRSLTALALITFSTLLYQPSTCAQGTAFTYQGFLADGGAPANGAYDLTFTLYDRLSGGNTVGASNVVNDLSITNGLFTVALDFGGASFDGSDRWLEIAVRPGASTDAYTNVAPRQSITATPYAMRALSFSGTISNAQLAGTYGNAVNMTNAANRFGGSFSGNGGGLTNLNAASLTGPVPAAALSNAWRIGGNNGTLVANNFIGTTDNQPLELRVNNARVLRLQPDASPANSPSVIGGSPLNVVTSGVVGAAIGGGGSAAYDEGGALPNTVASDYGTVGGGLGNDVAGIGATIGGGFNNNTLGFYALVGGGGVNFANGDYATVGGGVLNQATNTSSVIAGGRNNRVYGPHSSVVGGQDNQVAAGSEHCIIGGGRGNLIHIGTERAAISGGESNVLGTNAAFSVISGGARNQIGGAAYAATIGGGQDNRIFQHADRATIAGGAGNSIGTNADFAAIGGGINNGIDPNAEYATIGGGFANSATNTGTTVAGGLVNTSGGSYAAVGGGRNNISSGFAATVGGGTNGFAAGDFSTVAGGRKNISSDFATTVSGGDDNRSIASWATVGGGFGNLSSEIAATVAGGLGNSSSGVNSVVGGGRLNESSGFAATIPGGVDNVAAGEYSLAAGRQAHANHDGTFVWADDHATDFVSTGLHQFLIRAAGGVGIGHTAPDAPLHVVGGTDVNLASGGALILGAVSGLNMAIDSNEIQARNNSLASSLFLNAGGGNVSIGTATANARLRVVNATCDGEVWNNSSDRNLKAGFETVDAQSILAKVSALPISRWHYTNAPGTRHIGPMAQDFQAAFSVGSDDKHIATIDADGVALAAIQGLNALLKAQAAELHSLKDELMELRRAVSRQAEHSSVR